jgi:hypothetical protein
MDSVVSAMFTETFKILLSQNEDDLLKENSSVIDTFRMESQAKKFNNPDEAQSVSPIRSIAVVPAPPYPSEMGLKLITSNIVQIVDARLASLQASTRSFELISAEPYFDDLINRRSIDYDSIASELNTEYLWVASIRKAGHVRYVHMELRNCQNPFERKILRTFPLDHIDNLIGQVAEYSREMICEWLPWIKDSSNVLDPRKQVGYRAETAGIRLRIGLAGFLDQYRHIFYDDAYRQSLEASGIIYKMPWQVDFGWMLDLGHSTGGKSILGRYYSGILRYNFSTPGLLEDSRVFVAGGAAFMKVGTDSSNASSSFISIDPVLSAGVEIPFSPYLYWDLSGSLWYSFNEINQTGSFGPKNGRLTFLTVGVGLGYRIY